MRSRHAASVVSFGLLFCLAIYAGGFAAELGALSGPAGHGLGFIGERNTWFYVNVVAEWGGYNDRDPGALAEPLPGVVEAIPVGGYSHDVWSVGASVGDHFSARWTGVLRVPEARDYTFYLTSDDGARMWVDDTRIINEWIDRSPTTTDAAIALTAGDHPIRVEYFENGGGAVCRLEWSAPGLDRQVVPTDVITSDGQPGWKAEYFQNQELKGDAATDRAPQVNFDWGEGGPSAFGGEDPIVRLDCGRLSERVAVLRVRAPRTSYVGAILRGQPPARSRFMSIGDAIAGSIIEDDSPGWGGFTLRAIGRRPAQAVHEAASYAALWLPASEPVYLIAGQGPMPDLTEPQAEDIVAKCLASGQNAPLPSEGADAEGWVPLFNGKDLDGWLVRHPDQQNRWRVEDGVLINDAAGTDLYSAIRLGDFALHIEFNVGRGGNSGVYLQGRYEIQVADSAGHGLNPGMCGAIYQKAIPTTNACKPPGEWQSFDVLFRSPRLNPDGSIAQNARATVLQNGVTIISDAEIDGPTGSAMDGRVWEAHGLMLQGDHGPIKYRNIRVRQVPSR